MRAETFDDLLADHSPDVAALAARLRGVILEAHPEFTERLYRGWHGLGFHHPIAGYVAGLFPRQHEVNVGLEHGAELPDPHHLLQGTGRRPPARGGAPMPPLRPTAPPQPARGAVFDAFCPPATTPLKAVRKLTTRFRSTSLHPC